MLPGLYVHVPFCSRKCPYCDFYSISALDLIPLWLKALEKEAGFYAKSWPGPFETLYLGGGSPSLLTINDLKTLFETLEKFPLAENFEATIEANPEDVTEEKVKFWKTLGFNRVSLGVQSFNPQWLNASLSRNHTVADSKKAIDMVTSVGLSLSLDFIFAHPGQSPQEWAAELDQAAATWADHVSAYVLTPSPSTALGRALAAGIVPRLPGEELTSELFLLTGEALAMRGFERYEVSNFARGGAFCRHNLKYWHREPYLGLGPSAHSFDGQRRWANVSSVKRWAVALEAGRLPYEFIEELSPDQVRVEEIMLGLRLSEGLSRDLVKESETLSDLIKDGFLTPVGDKLKPSPKGMLMADGLAKILA
ncbi:MAG: radical SAM family heme chaperone HemW [Deltaproteobacteria bacterium]|jgi:oxygen-independent coproporphyrinogen-3 oxidase|nr:radical SAM family heme chaperone HemW [Deltaproteobacteria bacterium]